MTNTLDRAKHRAPRRTPVEGLALAAANPNVRRSALVASSSALVLTMVATTASAAPAAFDVATPKAGATTLTDTALESLSLSPTVSVAADLEYSVEEIVASAEPAPEPAPEPVVTSSRSGSRSATVSVSGSGLGAAVASIALRYIGVPYVYGGTTPAGFDCSGFTQYVYAQVGISLPRSSDGQRYAGTVIPASQAQAGDLIWSPGHVGIYLGDGQHIAARNPGTPIYVSPIYVSNPVFIRPYGM